MKKVITPVLFELGADYDEKMILDQIQVARDAGVSGWNSRNVYADAVYLEKLPDPNPEPPSKSALLEGIRKHEMARAGLENRSTVFRKGGPTIAKPVRK